MRFVNKVTATTLAFLAASSSGNAQAAGGPPKGTAGVEAMLLEEIPTVFGASRFDQLSTEAPASVSVVTREDIQRHGWRNLADVLQTVRGFYVTYDGLYQQVGSRGFGPPGDYNTRILLVIDGHRINENVFGSAMMGFESLVQVDDIERVEIIRGPSSSLYGAGAFFGVVNVVTSRGRALSGARARMSMESFGAREYFADAGTRLPAGVEVRASFSRRTSEGRDFFFAEFDTGSTGGWARGLDGETRSGATVRMNWGGLSLVGMASHRDKASATGRYVVDYGVSGIDYRDSNGLLGLAYERDLTPGAALRIQGSWHTYDYDGDYRYSGAPYSDWSRARWGVADAEYSTSALPGHRLVAGAQVMHNATLEQGYREDGELTFFGDQREDLYALYVQDEVRLGMGWILNGGLRLDHYESVGATLNPRFGLIRQLRHGSAVKFLYGSAFRMPGVYERYYDAVELRANPALGPERIRTAELLLEHQVNSHWKVTTAAFRNDATSLVDLVRPDGEAYPQYVNQGKARAMGLELEAEVEWRGARGRLSQVWQDAIDVRSDERLSNSPRWVSAADLTLPLGGARAGSLEIRNMSSRLASSGARVPGYTVANAWVTAPVPGLGLRLSAGVYNLLDATLLDPTGDEFLQASIPQPGRHFRVSMELGSR